MAEALVASEKVGEGGSEECLRLGEIASERKERAEGIGRRRCRCLRRWVSTG